MVLHSVCIACIAVLIKKNQSDCHRILSDKAIYVFHQLVQIIFTLVHNSKVCKHYRGSYYIGLVLFTMVCMTIDSNPYNGI